MIVPGHPATFPEGVLTREQLGQMASFVSGLLIPYKLTGTDSRYPGLAMITIHTEIAYSLATGSIELDTTEYINFCEQFKKTAEDLVDFLCDHVGSMIMDSKLARKSLEPSLN